MPLIAHGNHGTSATACAEEYSCNARRKAEALSKKQPQPGKIKERITLPETNSEFTPEFLDAWKIFVSFWDGPTWQVLR